MYFLVPLWKFTYVCPSYRQHKKLSQFARSLPSVCPSDTLLPTLLAILIRSLCIQFSPNVSFLDRNCQLLRCCKITFMFQCQYFDSVSHRLLNDHAFSTCLYSCLLFQLLVELVWIFRHLQLYGHVPGCAHDASAEASGTSSQPAAEVAKKAPSGWEAER